MLFRCKFYAVPLVGQARHALGIWPHGRPVGGEAEFAVGPAEAVEEMAGTEIRLAVMPALHAQSPDIGRSEERRAGKAGVSTARSRWLARESKKKKKKSE